MSRAFSKVARKIEGKMSSNPVVEKQKSKSQASGSARSKSVFDDDDGNDDDDCDKTAAASAVAVAGSHPAAAPATAGGTKAMPFVDRTKAPVLEDKGKTVVMPKVDKTKIASRAAAAKTVAMPKVDGSRAETKAMPKRDFTKVASKPVFDDDDDDDDEEEETKPKEPTKQAKSILFTSKDKKMAERQSRYATLAPKQREEQNEWAHEMLARSKGCPEGRRWIRGEARASWNGHAGYYCEKQGHIVTDPLLTEGKGGVYATMREKGERLGDLDRRFGPFYPHPTKTLNAEGEPATCHWENMKDWGYEVLELDES